MLRNRAVFATLVTIVVLLVLVRWRGNGGGTTQAGDEPPVPAPEETPVDASLAELRALPAAWLGRPVRFTVQFQGHVETWNPFHTRFGTEEWKGFTAWADESLLWDVEAFEDPAPRLFVARFGMAAEALVDAKSQDRFAVEAVVREVFLDEPWIEVRTVAPLEEHVPDGSILHVIRGREFLAAGQPVLAREQFERAGAAPLPPIARAELDRLLARCGPPDDGE